MRYSVLFSGLDILLMRTLLLRAESPVFIAYYHSMSRLSAMTVSTTSPTTRYIPDHAVTERSLVITSSLAVRQALCGQSRRIFRHFCSERQEESFVYIVYLYCVWRAHKDYFVSANACRLQDTRGISVYGVRASIVTDAFHDAGLLGLDLAKNEGGIWKDENGDAYNRSW